MYAPFSSVVGLGLKMPNCFAPPKGIVLVTADRNMQYQQNVDRLPIPVVVLIASSNRLESLLPVVPELLKVLAEIKPGQFRCVAVPSA
ncbi:MAG: hypothetical protein PHE55_17235 [Methylococcaceae bacterium]|nr:hypothetical protein [Methylococcaceae bacterium]